MKTMKKFSWNQPPDHLSDHSKALWRQITPNHARGIGRLALLQAALESLDRADSARQTVAKDGMVLKTSSTGVFHIHPLIKVEKEARAQFMKAWQALHLHWHDQAPKV